MLRHQKRNNTLSHNHRCTQNTNKHAYIHAHTNTSFIHIHESTHKSTCRKTPAHTHSNSSTSKHSNRPVNKTTQHTLHSEQSHTSTHSNLSHIRKNRHGGIGQRPTMCPHQHGGGFERPIRQRIAVRISTIHHHRVHDRLKLFCDLHPCVALRDRQNTARVACER
jgi:hypothetical protein